MAVIRQPPERTEPACPVSIQPRTAGRHRKSPGNRAESLVQTAGTPCAPAEAHETAGDTRGDRGGAALRSSGMRVVVKQGIFFRDRATAGEIITKTGLLVENGTKVTRTTD